MPRVFDNIKDNLLPALRVTMQSAGRGDFCVGYFNLYGWQAIDEQVEAWDGGEEACCRLLIGMQKLPKDELKQHRSFFSESAEPDSPTVVRLRKKLVEEFRQQLTLGSPSVEDEKGLRRLRQQLLQKKLFVKLHLRHPLHAKLYLLFRSDPVTPIVGYLGSSNLTMAGLAKQGELNVDVTDQDASDKLAKWFEERWEDSRSVDISEDLAQLIAESWAREELIPPHHIYIKMAYHLSREAREGLNKFRVPPEFEDELFDFQVAAVKIAARYLNRHDDDPNRRSGVLIGDVVGLGKTLMATALARIVWDDQKLETLILCPKSLVKMWEEYRYRYKMQAKIMSMGSVINHLPNLPRYRLMIIDESHNLRNRDAKRYRVIQDYIKNNGCKCILLSATPYNKTYTDLSNQLRLFVDESEDLGIRPERLLREMGETGFASKHQVAPHSLAAFEKSEQPDDWRDLMRLYLVRRTRSFIQKHYAETDPETGRRYLTYANGNRSYFPERVPKTVKFEVGGQYASLFSDSVVEDIKSLDLPRYGLKGYIDKEREAAASGEDAKLLGDLSRAGKRLRGFCRINLLKRLESSGPSFLLSVERHILRNFVYLHAIESGQPLPIGSATLDDFDFAAGDTDPDDTPGSEQSRGRLRDEQTFRKHAAGIYERYAAERRNDFRWISPAYFEPSLRVKLQQDADTLRKILEQSGAWDVTADSKLDALYKLLTEQYPGRKVIVFTQFADTVHYLTQELQRRGVKELAAVSGESENPTELAHRFSPRSNPRPGSSGQPPDELRVLVSTDVLSEGQNLQDCAVVVNYDLPWAIVRLIQRAGRVDRIGQRAEKIYCHSFMPADGIEKRIKLRKRMRERLAENAEVVGTDEKFFENEERQKILDLYNETSGILDDDEDAEVDLSSYALQIWKDAIAQNPSLEETISGLPNIVHSTKALPSSDDQPEGLLIHVRTAQGNDALARVNRQGESITESQFEILRAAACEPDEPGLPRHKTHYELVRDAAEKIAREERESAGGQLGSPRGARFRVYELLNRYQATQPATLFETEALENALADIYRFPLQRDANDALNRQLRSKAPARQIADLVLALRDKSQLCIEMPDASEEQVSDARRDEPQIICSMGLLPDGKSP